MGLGPHSDICHPTQVNTPRLALTQARQAVIRLTCLHSTLFSLLYQNVVERSVMQISVVMLLDIITLPHDK